MLYWSGGKDSAMALHDLQSQPAYAGYRTARLLTTFTEGYDRVTGHGVRRELIEDQAAGLGIELVASYIPKRATMRQYEDVTARHLSELRRCGIRHASSGDIFREKQRMAQLQRAGLTGCFPLWNRHSHGHAKELIERGFKALVVCVDAALLGAELVGRALDHDFLRDLPTGVDPCGENGEFHTFVFDGPVFAQPIRCTPGIVVTREGFHFCDLIPGAR
ncbi:MAG TPA: ATP-binding protein [Thermoanaerobaculia bacterium]